MVVTGSGKDIAGLITALRAEPTEAEWFEFKANNDRPEKIGEYLSALSNSARLADQPYAYVIWGVEDSSHELIGTTFDPSATRKGGEDLEPWLLRGLQPQRWFHFSSMELDGRRVVVLEIEPAAGTPTAFDGQRWIRVKSYNKPLAKNPSKEQRLWRKLLEPATAGPVRASCSASDVVELINLSEFLRVMSHPASGSLDRHIELLEADGVISRSLDGRFEILTPGALLFARSLRDFPTLRSKAVRVLEYPELAKTGSPTSDHTHEAGYAIAFDGLYQYIVQRIPRVEVIEGAERLEHLAYPPLAVRELLANSLIHQDLDLAGTGPLVEIFPNRIEFSNPGAPLIPVDRLLDHPPQSRNETVANFMFRAGYCERRGGGIDKVVESVERLQHPPPRFLRSDQSFAATLFNGLERTQLRKDDRLHALYLHACLLFVNGERVTNESVRQRFQLTKSQASLASRYIKEALEAGQIAPYDASAGKRSMSYVPVWASAEHQ